MTEDRIRDAIPALRKFFPHYKPTSWEDVVTDYARALGGVSEYSFKKAVTIWYRSSRYFPMGRDLRKIINNGVVNETKDWFSGLHEKDERRAAEFDGGGEFEDYETAIAYLDSI